MELVLILILLSILKIIQKSKSLLNCLIFHFPIQNVIHCELFFFFLYDLLLFLLLQILLFLYNRLLLNFLLLIFFFFKPFLFNKLILFLFAKQFHFLFMLNLFYMGFYKFLLNNLVPLALLL
jgi:hypothetical protein